MALQAPALGRKCCGGKVGDAPGQGEHRVQPELQAKIGRARDQLLVFLDHPGRVEATNNACERALRPAVIQRKVTNGYRAMWAAEGEAAVRTVVDTARLTGASPFGTILKTVSA